jgi:hypothetical protein
MSSYSLLEGEFGPTVLVTARTGGAGSASSSGICQRGRFSMPSAFISCSKMDKFIQSDDAILWNGMRTNTKRVGIEIADYLIYIWNP